MTAEVIAFISDSCSWEIRASFHPLEIFNEQKSIFDPTTIIINVHTQLLITRYLYNILSLPWVVFPLKITECLK